MKVKIQYEIKLPDIKCTDEEIEEFLQYEIGNIRYINGSNPLIKEEITPIPNTFNWRWI